MAMEQEKTEMETERREIEQRGHEQLQEIRPCQRKRSVALQGPVRESELRSRNDADR